MAKVNVRLKGSDTWITYKDGKITETLIKGAALELELTETLQATLDQYPDAEAVPVVSAFESEVNKHGQETV